MSDFLQSAPHPDADQLTAFAEHALPPHEREQTLAHLATCAACRQLVFLAHGAEPVEVPQPVAAKKPWFTGWNLLWPAAAALAGIVGFSVSLRKPNPVVDKPAQPQVAIVTETPPIPPAVPAPAAKAAPPRPAISALQPPAPPKPVVADSLDQDVLQSQQHFLPSPRKLDKVTTARLHGPMATQRQLVANGAPPIQAPADVASAAVGMAAPPPPATPTSSVALSAGMAGMASASPQPAPPPPAPVNLGQTLRAAAAAAPMPAAPGAAPPAAAQQTVDVSAATADIEVTNAPTVELNAAVIAELPSGRATLSKVSEGSRIVALDTNGTLFVSKDDGGHWTQVKPQWPGRAVQVSLNSAYAPAGNVAGRARKAKAANGLSIAHNAAASGDRAMIVGSVTDPTGAAIPGATIRLKNAAGMEVSTVRADAQGRFATGALDAGKYVVQISMPGFATFAQTLELQARDRASLGAVLKVAAESETVTVSTAAETVDLAKPKPDPFTLTTDTGAIWTSKDGQKWKRQ